MRVDLLAHVVEARVDALDDLVGHGERPHTVEERLPQGVHAQLELVEIGAPLLYVAGSG